MTIHVNIGQAKTRLSELVAAAVRGEEVVLAKAGDPQVRLVPVAERQELDNTARAAKRRSALGMWKGVITAEQATIPPSMTDEELEERWNRKFGPAA